MSISQRSINKETLLMLARKNPAAFYQYLRQALGQVERIAVGKLSDEQVLDLALDHVRCGRIKLNLDNNESDNYFSVNKNQISENSYMQRAKARGSAPAEEFLNSNSDEQASRPTVNDKTRWVAFKICDEESGEPIANVELKIQLPDGNVRRFFTDAEGLVKIEGMDYGPLHILDIKHISYQKVSQFN